MNRADQLAFISRIAPGAQQSAAQFGVPASVTIAQAILESSWGQSKLSTDALNYFGIKARRADDYAEFETTEDVKGAQTQELARFRKFKSVPQCFSAHAELLSGADRYRAAMAEADDPFVFAARLAECGYSTDPGYANKLAQLITEFRLTGYDVKAAAKKA